MSYARGMLAGMLPLKTIKGDATSPQAKGRKVIAHICNDLGGWGKGFVLAISRRWPEPERDYRARCRFHLLEPWMPATPREGGSDS